MSIFKNLESNSHNLRTYQSEIKSKVYEYFSNKDNRSLLVQMPTGAGKTKLFCSIVRDIQNKGAELKRSIKVLLIAHTDELINQIKNNLSSSDYRIASGIIKSQIQPEPRFPVQIASIQTLSRDINKENRTYKHIPDLIIIDEAHHSKADSYQLLWQAFPNANIIGFTATPCRTDGSGLKDIFQSIILGPTIRHLIKNNYLAKPKYYTPNIGYDLAGVNVQAGDYSTTDLEDLINKQPLNENLVKAYEKHVNGKKGIVYAVTQNHADAITQAYNERKINAEYIDSNTDAQTRKEIINRFAQGITKVLVNVKIFTEGFDCPNVDFVQLARPSKSLIMYYQQVGRCLRTDNGKEYAYILDNAGLSKEHGLFINEPKWEELFEGIDNHVNNRERIIDEEYKKRNNENGDEIEIDLQEVLIHDIDTIVEDSIEERNVTIIDFFNDKILEIFNFLKSKNYYEVDILSSLKLLDFNAYDISYQNYLTYISKEKELKYCFSAIEEFEAEKNSLKLEIDNAQNQPWKIIADQLKAHLSNEAIKAALKIDYPEIEEFSLQDLNDLNAKIAEIEYDIKEKKSDVEKLNAQLLVILKTSKDGNLYSTESTNENIKKEIIDNESKIEIDFKDLISEILSWIQSDENKKKEILYPSQIVFLKDIINDNEFDIEKLTSVQKTNLNSLFSRVKEKGYKNPIPFYFENKKFNKRK